MPSISGLSTSFISFEDTHSSNAQDDSLELKPEQVVNREITWRDKHSFRLALAAGQYGRIVVEQQGIDLVVTLFGPDGQLLMESDSPAGAHSLESVSVLAETAGEYRLELRSVDKGVSPAAYQLRVEAVRLPTPADQERLAAERAVAEGRKLQAQGTEEARQKAIAKYEESLPHWQAIADPYGEANALHFTGKAYKLLGNLEKASQYYNRALVLRRAANDLRGEAATLYDLGAAYRDLDKPENALPYYERARLLYTELSDRAGQAYILHHTGFVYQMMFNLQMARQFYEQALPLWRAERNLRRETVTINNLGGVYDESGEPQKALEMYDRASQIWHEIGDPDNEAIALSNVGKVYDDLAEPQKALEYYNKALAALPPSKQRSRTAATTLDNIGLSYAALNDPQRALEQLNKSLSIRQEVKEPGGIGATLSHIGYVYALQGEAQESLKYNEQALLLLQKVGNKDAQANALDNLGLAHSVLNQTPEALQAYQQSLAIKEGLKTPRKQAVTLERMGQLYTSMGDLQKAEECYQRALSLWQAVEDQPGEAMALYGLAHVESQRDRLPEANAYIEKAIKLVEAFRAKVNSQQLRAYYFAAKLNYYELSIDVKMRLNKVKPTEGFEEAALFTSESGNARNLLETLSNVRPKLPESVDPRLLERKRALQQRLSVKAEIKRRLLNEGGDKERIGTLSREISSLNNEYDDLASEINRRSPRYAALIQPMGVREIQQLLDENTLLLEYALGEKRSYLWALTAKGLSGYQLPPRKDVEALVTSLRESLLAREPVRGSTPLQNRERVLQADTQYARLSADLSKVLLGPVAGQLGKRRLVIVAGGILQYIPFGALPVPATEERAVASSPPSPGAALEAMPLFEEHEIVYEPSASTLAALRVQAGQRKPALKKVAVLADAVFESDDLRLPSVSKRSSAVPAEQPWLGDLNKALRSSGLSRLPSSAQEAADIMSLVPAEAGMVATGFKANRRLATSLELNQYQIVHFATHGILDDENPELSGIVLSLFDEKGQPQDGFLRLHDIYDLSLPSELVVLSACRTGLGKEIKGEGMIGLIRGFMYAGTTRVVASLWKVDDEATAELMKHFYAGLLKDNLTPAAAMRLAQSEMRKQRRWRAPYYWAGFVLEGEWKGWTTTPNMALAR